MVSTFFIVLSFMHSVSEILKKLLLLLLLDDTIFSFACSLKLT